MLELVFGHGGRFEKIRWKKLVCHYLTDQSRYSGGNAGIILYFCQEEKMECIISYLLLALFFDQIVELVRLDDGEEEAVWIKRRLWTNAPFDCGTRVSSTIVVRLGKSKADIVGVDRRIFTQSNNKIGFLIK